MSSIITLIASVPDPSYASLKQDAIILGILLAVVLAAGGALAALFLVFTPGAEWLGVLIILAGLLAIYGYIRLLIKLRKAKKALRAQRKAAKPSQ